MDTSTDFMTAIEMPMGIFLDCYDTLAEISDTRNEELQKSMDAIKNKK